VYFSCTVVIYTYRDMETATTKKSSKKTRSKMEETADGSSFLQKEKVLIQTVHVLFSQEKQANLHELQNCSL